MLIIAPKAICKGRLASQQIAVLLHVERMVKNRLTNTS